MKLSRSFSDHSVYCNYVCLVSGVNPSHYESPENSEIYDISPHVIITDADEDNENAIQVERSKAVHELVKTNTGKDKPSRCTPVLNEPTPPEPEGKGCATDSFPNPNILSLTKMKWLTEHQEDGSISSSASVSCSSSASSVCSKERLSRSIKSCDKCLSTILRLDKEHNMFGLSNIAIVGAKISRKSRKENEKPAFPQTAIIQVCCGNRCCKHKSNSDLPVSLKCGGCYGRCYDPCCPTCPIPNALNCDAPCPSHCSSCAKMKCTNKVPCLPSSCLLDWCRGRGAGGMKIVLKRKPKYEPSPIELTPRSSSVLQKPEAARTCHHTPQCCPPSSCCPYLLPCYWPARPGAPCSHPSRCFHNPPCRPPRRRKVEIPPEELCPKGVPCVDEKRDQCPNAVCPGNNPVMKQAIESRFGSAQEETNKWNSCECNAPKCTNCFVKRWNGKIINESASQLNEIKENVSEINTIHKMKLLT